MLKSKMADEEEVEVRGLKRPLVENYSDEDEEEEARRKEGNSLTNLDLTLVNKALQLFLLRKFFMCAP